jgi:hypothetical protein
MATRFVRALGAALLGLLGASAARSEPLRILYAEPFQLQSTQPQAQSKPGAQSARVNAFGRAMSLALEDNSRLLRAASPQTRARLGSSSILKGSISGVAGSWIRLTLTDGAYSGAIWDGSDLYFVEPRATIEQALIVPLAGTAQGSAIYRLADTQGGAFQAACGVDSNARESVAPLANYRALVRELQAAAVAAPREIEVALVADHEFTSFHNTQGLTRMLSQANVVDGIFGEQVGVAIVPTDFVLFESATDPFTSSNPVTLLEEFGEFREQTPAIRSRGLAHLMTGREIDGNVIGIAYLGALCARREGVGLSEVSFRFDTPLIMAHELGHNFGAPHDTEQGSSCAATPPGFLMEPRLNFSSTFSTCSVQRMQSHIAGASCVVTARTRDVAVSVPAATIDAFPDVPFDYVVDVASTGDAAAANVVLTIPLISGLQLDSFAMPGERCRTTGQPVLVCEIPELAAGETRRLTAQMRARVEGEFDLSASATSTNDASSTNDSQTVQVSVVSGRDFQITVAPQPLTVAKGDQFEMTFDVAATGSRTLTDIRLEVSHGGLAALSGTIATGTCTVPNSTPPILTCTLPTLEPGVPRRLRAQLRADHLTSGTAGGNIRVYEAANMGGQRYAPFVVQTVASRDIAVTTTSPTLQRVALGTDAIWTLNVRSTGINPANDVALTFTRQSLSSLVTVAVDQPLGASCTTQGFILTCPLGTMAPGATRTVRVRAQAAEETDVHVTTQSQLAGLWDDDLNNDRLHFIARVGLDNDVSLQNVSGTAAFEENDGMLRAVVRTLGVNASQNVVVTATLPAGLLVVAADLDGNNCPLQPGATNVVACSLAQLPAQSSATLAVRYRGDVPGLYPGGRLEVSADADMQASNNAQAVTFTISPYIDGELIAPPIPRLRTDISTELLFRVTTNKRTLPDARVDFSWSQLADVVATAPGVTCVTSATGLSCPLSTLPPNSDIPIALRARGVARTFAFLNASLIASADNTPGNNLAFLVFEQIDDPGEATVVISNQTAIEGERTALSLFLNVTAEIHDVVLELDYDPSRLVNVTLVTGCTSMPTPHRCEVGASRLPGSFFVQLAFTPAGIGPAPITVRVRSANDANPANDAASATVTINAPSSPPPPPPPPPPAPPPSPPPPSGGGGGGGSVEWSLALLLAVISLMRRRRAIRAG